MMTKHQYDRCSPYKDICSMFVKTGEYVGGADGLFDFYKDAFNSGVSLNTGCNDCKGAALIHVNQMLNDYERDM